MKKTLCLILSIIMSLSLLAVGVGAEAATGFEGQTLKVNVTKLRKAGTRRNAGPSFL